MRRSHINGVARQGKRTGAQDVAHGSRRITVWCMMAEGRPPDGGKGSARQAGPDCRLDREGRGCWAERGNWAGTRPTGY
jgi:hypothetical protein